MTRQPAVGDEPRSNLKTFIPLMVQNPAASVRCPHCENEFMVDGKRWRAPLMSVVKPGLEITGRSCPYCMKVSLIPLEFFPKKDRARIAALRQ
jgi:uncharacterized Zn-finger protein